MDYVKVINPQNSEQFVIEAKKSLSPEAYSFYSDMLTVSKGQTNQVNGRVYGFFFEDAFFDSVLTELAMKGYLAGSSEPLYRDRSTGKAFAGMLLYAHPDLQGIEIPKSSYSVATGKPWIWYF